MVRIIETDDGEGETTEVAKYNVNEINVVLRELYVAHYLILLIYLLQLSHFSFTMNYSMLLSFVYFSHLEFHT